MFFQLSTADAAVSVSSPSGAVLMLSFVGAGLEPDRMAGT
jgi:hypothetical protein